MTSNPSNEKGSCCDFCVSYREVGGCEYTKCACHRAPSPAGWEERFAAEFPDGLFHAEWYEDGSFRRCHSETPTIKSFIKDLLAKRDAELVEKVKNLPQTEGVGSNVGEWESGFYACRDSVLRLLKGE